MHTIGPETPLVLRPPRAGLVLRLLGSLAGAAAGLALGRAGLTPGWFLAGIAGLWAGVFLLQMAPGATFLRLDADGFTARCLYRDQAFRWADVERFGVSKGLAGYVAFNFAPGFAGALRTRRLADAIGGYERLFLSHYGMRPEELAELLNDCRRRYAPRPDDQA